MDQGLSLAGLKGRTAGIKKRNPLLEFVIMTDALDILQVVSRMAEAGVGKGKKGKKDPSERSAKDRAQDDQVMGVGFTIQGFGTLN